MENQLAKLLTAAEAATGTTGGEADSQLDRGNMMKIWTAALGCAALLAACAATTAVITDLEEDKAIVQMTGGDYSVADAEAQRGCEVHGKVPVRVSERCLDDSCKQRSILYACKAPE